jgi:hypothetical protein
MRKLLFSVSLLALMAVPAQARTSENFNMGIILGPVQFFSVNNISPLIFTFDQYSDFDVPQDIGDINYDLVSNTGWQVEAIILDNSSGGQTADDWDAVNWTLSVNGVAVSEDSSNVIDTSPDPVNRTQALWPVLLTIPWPEGLSTPDCWISLTASTL